MGSRGSKINNPWNREGERVIYFVSHIVFVCVGGGWGWGEGGM